MRAWWCAPDQIYQTPPGFWDQSYIYAFDTDAIADGINIQNLSIPIEGNAEFRCRKVDGAPRIVNPVTGQIQLKDRLGIYCSRAPLFPDHLRSVAVVPERYFPSGGQIGFDLWTTLRAANAVPPNTTYTSQIAFRGVHRRAGRELIQTRYPFRQKPFVYTQPLVINWLATAALATRRFSQAVQDADFELVAIRLYDLNAGTTPGPGVLLKMMLHDALERRLSNVPLLMDYWMENSEIYPGNVFSPPVLYPAGCEIIVDVQSLALAGQIPLNYEIELVGMRRWPA